jgi:hypothetical protein
MAPDDIAARLLQFPIAGEILSMEGPIRVSVQFFITLVEAVDRQEEGFRIGGMYGFGILRDPTASHMGRSGSSIRTSFGSRSRGKAQGL